MNQGGLKFFIIIRMMMSVPVRVSMNVGNKKEAFRARILKQMSRKE
jgi:hypothetical protein